MSASTATPMMVPPMISRSLVRPRIAGCAAGFGGAGGLCCACDAGVL